ncbi:MAG: carbon starvation protein A [Candidatus Omnitrophica bacterium]|nr:carbon starvation protein A [Candidatus Omnitrophota bacterium]
MNSLFVILISGVLFFWGYCFYAKKIEDLWHINPKASTPAYAKFDSVDYIPAKNWLVLFGHHFSSIAGAGPIIGPVIACCLWGWLPALVWIILGAVFLGGVHDFGALITSVREGGSSIADISQNVISRRAKILFSLFVWLALILVIAVFAYLSADTFIKEPAIVIPSLGLILVAVVVGILLYNFKTNIILTTLFGLTLLAGLVFLGNIFPVALAKYALNIWIAILFVYSYFASILPVNILLQPRDYLSSFLLFFGAAAGIIGILITRPNLNTPFYNKWVVAEGPLWPILCITIACGALSGFHSLISSGTTSKQLPNERYAKRIGYGAMLLEGIVAVLAVIAVSIGLKGNQSLATALKQLGPINIFGQGYAQITQPLLGKYSKFIAITILNAFILTTLDTATRICRYITEELFKIKNRFLSTAIVVILSALIAFSGKWSKIWPAFGASNQLVAALALLVVSCWLLAKNKSIKFTFIPAVLILVTTVTALFVQIANYIKTKEVALSVICGLLIILAFFIIWEAGGIFKLKLFRR